MYVCMYVCTYVCMYVCMYVLYIIYYILYIIYYILYIIYYILIIIHYTLYLIYYIVYTIYYNIYMHVYVCSYISIYIHIIQLLIIRRKEACLTWKSISTSGRHHLSWGNLNAAKDAFETARSLGPDQDRFRIEANRVTDGLAVDPFL